MLFILIKFYVFSFEIEKLNFENENLDDYIIHLIF